MKTMIPAFEHAPTDWTFAPLWSKFTRKKILGKTNLPMVSVFRDRGVVFKDEFENLNKTAEDRSIYQYVGPGWLVVNRMKSWQGSVGVSAIEGITSGHYICFEPTHNECSAFLNYLVRSTAYRDLYLSFSRGVRPSQQEIQNDWLEQFPLLLPPLETQQRIANYLDQETAEIDAAVADLDRYVELLEKRRSVLITEIVTGRMMSEWGTVPAGLVMDRYREIAGMRSPEYKRLSLTLGGVIPRKRDDAEGLQPTNFEGYQVLPEGSLVFKLIDLENVATSRVGLSTETGIVSPAYIVVQPRSDRLFAKFGYYAFWDLYKRNYFNSMGSDGVRSALNYSDLARIRIPLPPLDEQQRISDYLDHETARIDALIAESAKLRELLIQRRSVLITEVVTGRKQV